MRSALAFFTIALVTAGCGPVDEKVTGSSPPRTTAARPTETEPQRQQATKTEPATTTTADREPDSPIAREADALAQFD